MTRRTRWAGRAVAGAVAATLTVLLAQVPVGASFTSVTGDGPNKITSSANFCAKTQFASVAGTAWTDQAAPTANHGNDPVLQVRTSGSNAARRTWVRFALPPAKPGCTLYAATLRLYDTTPTANRVIDLYRADPAAPTWTATGITWSNQPAGIGTPVGGSLMTTPGYQVWGITSEVLAQYASGNNGFLLQDRLETDPAGATQLYDGAASGPTGLQLQLDWG